MPLSRRQILALLLLAAGALPAVADDGGSEGGNEGGENEGEHDGDHDHDDARDAVERGEVMPLHEALEIVREANRGRVIDMQLTRAANGYVYAFKLKASSGRVTTLRMDARTGRVISMFGS